MLDISRGFGIMNVGSTLGARGFCFRLPGLNTSSGVEPTRGSFTFWVTKRWTGIMLKLSQRIRRHLTNAGWDLLTVSDEPTEMQARSGPRQNSTDRKKGSEPSGRTWRVNAALANPSDVPWCLALVLIIRVLPPLCSEPLEIT